MKIYLDLILFLNFMFDFILLASVGIILKRVVVIKKLICSALIGSLTTFLLFLPINSFFLFISKLIISLLMVLISFGYRDIRYMCRNLFYLYTSSMILGGGMYLLNIQFDYKQYGLVVYNNGLSVNFIILLILSPMIIYFYIKQIKLLRVDYSKYYIVDIYFKDGTKEEVTAFLDTGNKLIDPYKGRPIILVNKQKIIKNYYDNMVLVPFDTVNSHGLLKCVIPEKIDILGVGIYTEVLVGISEQQIKIDGVDCILHEKTVEGTI